MHNSETQQKNKIYSHVIEIDLEAVSFRQLANTVYERVKFDQLLRSPK